MLPTTAIVPAEAATIVAIGVRRTVHGSSYRDALDKFSNSRIVRGNIVIQQKRNPHRPDKEAHDLTQ